MSRLNFFNIRNTNLSDYTGKLSIRYGIGIFVVLVLYFWLAYLFNFVHVPVMRAFNLVIQSAGIYLACRAFKRSHQGSLNYFRAQVICFGASAIGTALFSLFLLILFSVADGLFEHIARGVALGKYLTPFTVSFAVFVEGAASGIIGSLIVANAIETDKVNQ
jgi:hypothetical protein